MAISEACQVWIEQRIEEELEVQSHTKKSLRAIGRDIAKEIERVFEAKVNPETIKSRVLRMTGLNEPPQATPEEDSGIQEKPSEIRDNHGRFSKGTVHGPGRRPKYITHVNPKEKIVSQEFKKAYEAMLREISNAKSLNWKTTSKEAALKYVGILLDVITIT